MALVNNLSNFRAAIALTDQLIAAAHKKDAHGIPLWTAAEISPIVEAAFLKFFISWENFLETSFHDYMLGEVSISGTSYVRYVAPIDLAHAKNVAIGALKYIDWKKSDVVKQLARNFFDQGEPFVTALAALGNDLDDLIKIRNAAAHLSSTTSATLDTLALRKLRVPVTNITVADLILRVDPGSATGETIMRTYTGILDGAATLIAT